MLICPPAQQFMLDRPSFTLPACYMFLFFCAGFSLLRFQRTCFLLHFLLPRFKRDSLISSAFGVWFPRAHHAAFLSSALPAWITILPSTLVFCNCASSAISFLLVFLLVRFQRKTSISSVILFLALCFVFLFCAGFLNVSRCQRDPCFFFCASSAIHQSPACFITLAFLLFALPAQILGHTMRCQRASCLGSSVMLLGIIFYIILRHNSISYI